jgi:carbonic anhydrase
MNSATADQAIARLKQGNERFRTGQAVGARWLESSHAELIESQRPFAIILSCSDSRVPTENIFDTGFGDLFVVRVAGNVANPSSIASIEYAVAYLGAKLIVVMAHQSCGAVTAAMEGGDASKSMCHLLSHIQPALDPADKNVDAVAKRNAKINSERLIDKSEIIREAVKENGIRIVTAFFHFSNGKVDFD